MVGCYNPRWGFCGKKYSLLKSTIYEEKNLIYLISGNKYAIRIKKVKLCPLSSGNTLQNKLVTCRQLVAKNKEQLNQTFKWIKIEQMNKQSNGWTDSAAATFLVFSSNTIQEQIQANFIH